MQIDASDTNIQYLGRYDASSPDKIVMAYPGVCIKTAFEGTAIDAVFQELAAGGAQHTNYFYVMIDEDIPFKLELKSSQTVYPLASGLSDTIHTVELFKLTEAYVGTCEFHGFRLPEGKTLLPLFDTTAMKIEFIGNSITCGYGNEATYTASQLSTISGFNSVNENNYLAWGAVTARNLNAQYQCTAYSGRGLYMNNDGSASGTLPKLYDYTIPDQTSLVWDHNRFVPDVIVINLGTNDFAAEANNITSVDENTFETTYVSFINKLRGYYPVAKIICVVGPMMSDYWPVGKQHWTRIQSYVSTVVSQLQTAGDSNVYYYKLDPQTEPYGEDWHPTIATHQSMADKLTAYIQTITGNSSGDGNDSICPSPDYAGISSAWSAYVDSYGSQVVSLNTSGPVEVHFSQVAQPSPNEYPWCTLSCDMGSDLSNATNIVLTYESDQTLQISLPQPPLDETGESYMYQLSATSEYTTVTIPVSSFAQPSWVSNTVSLDLSKVTGVAFAPVFSSPDQSGTAVIKIKDLTVYRSGCTLTVSDLKENTDRDVVSVKRVDQSYIYCNVLRSDDYEIFVYSMDGRLIYAKRCYLQKGFNRLPWKGQGLNGLCIVSIRDKQYLTSKPVFIDK